MMRHLPSAEVRDRGNRVSSDPHGSLEVVSCRLPDGSRQARRLDADELGVDVAEQGLLDSDGAQISWRRQPTYVIDFIVSLHRITIMVLFTRYRILSFLAKTAIAKIHEHLYNYRDLEVVRRAADAVQLHG